MAIMLMHKAGVLDLKVEWHRYLAAHPLWLMLVPVLYATMCEVARGRESPAVLLTIMRTIGVALVTVFGLLFVCMLVF